MGCVLLMPLQLFSIPPTAMCLVVCDILCRRVSPFRLLENRTNIALMSVRLYRVASHGSRLARCVTFAAGIAYEQHNRMTTRMTKISDCCRMTTISMVGSKQPYLYVGQFMNIQYNSMHILIISEGCMVHNHTC